MAFEKFHWTSASGVEVSLPHISKVPAGVLRKFRKLDPMDFVFSILEDVSDDAMLAKVDSLSVPEVNDLFEAWQADSSVGESSGSST